MRNKGRKRVGKNIQLSKYNSSDIFLYSAKANICFSRQKNFGKSNNSILRHVSFREFYLNNKRQFYPGGIERKKKRETSRKLTDSEIGSISETALLSA